MVNLCELKHRNSKFTIDKDEANKLLHKANVYREVTKTNKLIFISLVTTFGLKEAESAGNIVASSATIDDLFK